MFALWQYRSTRLNRSQPLTHIWQRYDIVFKPTAGDEAPVGYNAMRNELTVLGKLVLRGARLVMPKTPRRRAVNLAHEGHQGIVKTEVRLRSKVRLPGSGPRNRSSMMVMSCISNCWTTGTTRTCEVDGAAYSTAGGSGSRSDGTSCQVNISSW